MQIHHGRQFLKIYQSCTYVQYEDLPCPGSRLTTSQKSLRTFLEKLDSRFDRDDCFDVPEADVGDDLGDQRGGLDGVIRRVSGILRRHSP